MSMDTKMADSVESVLALIKNLSGKAKQGQETELEEIRNGGVRRFCEAVEANPDLRLTWDTDNLF